ncbi:hypothetical protein FIBSPDRAFT_856532 [Athelia psychrophila]|uniref:Uncharacterized protein n=1 Tax=Athelia psychrophila TaxID=1759441 RepID=A0A166N8T9_9AGAM|nr:hypothetical protein FIBSPDRAFT_856532 [Fibularhizoctonia sp. CBS 109695]
MTALISVFLTAMYSLLLKKDFSGYSMLQRGDMAGHGARATILHILNTPLTIGTRTSGTTIFAILLNCVACNLFGGNNMCRMMSFATAVANWALCGLLFLFGASVAVVACRPSAEDSALRSLTMSPSPRPASINSLTRLVSGDVEKQPHYPVTRLQNPYSPTVNNMDPAALYRADTRPGIGMARQPMMTPTPGQPRPVRPATRPTLIVPPRAALAQRLPSARGPASNRPRVGFAPAPPRIVNPAERAAVVKAGGGMEWRKLVLDADYL